jgi:hypothetical protein
MRDFIRFVWRGAVGGAIVPSLVVAYYLIILFGSPLFWIFLISFSFSLIAIPGAIVGAVLWICALFRDRLGLVLRVMIGMAIYSVPLLMEWLRSDELLDYSPQSFRRAVVWTAFNLLFGGMAGLLCPATRIYRREPEPPYWERVRQYEAAQAEHDLRKAQLTGGPKSSETFR